MTTPPGSTGPNGNADRVWLRTDLPMEARVEALLAEMTLAEKVGQTHQSANIDPIADAELIRRGGIGSSLLASGAPFGWGLTYTTFSYGPIRWSSNEMPLNGGSVEVNVDVTNSGTRPGREVVQLYLRDLVADVTRPLLELADWVSLVLDPGSPARQPSGSPLRSSPTTTAP